MAALILCLGGCGKEKAVIASHAVVAGDEYSALLLMLGKPDVDQSWAPDVRRPDSVTRRVLYKREHVEVVMVPKGVRQWGVMQMLDSSNRRVLTESEVLKRFDNINGRSRGRR